MRLLDTLSPSGGEGINKLVDVLQNAMRLAPAQKKHPKHLLFFTSSAVSQKAADEFLGRLSQRKKDQVKPVTNETIQAQAIAITKWGSSDSTSLSAITQPVLIANGDHDIMVPSINSWSLFQKLPNAILSIFPDAGHGGIFQYHEVFVP